MPTPRLTISARAVLFVGCVLFIQPAAGWSADEITIDEPATDVRVRQVATEVRTSGKIFTNAGNSKTNEHTLTATAMFRYRERRLPPAGRDFQSLRALREFELAKMQSQVAGHDTGAELPASQRLVVVHGDRNGMQCYSPGHPMARESVDLLELPGDPLILAALLPRTPVTPGAQWKAPEWAAQMLASLEAVDKAEMNCRLTTANAATAVIEFNGSVHGQRYGANSDVTIAGRLTFDRQSQMIRQAVAKYGIKSSVGTINPGIDATVDVTVERVAADSPGGLTDAVAEVIPLEPAPGNLLLEFAAPPWGVALSFDRKWFVFQALFEGTPQVAILRLMENGSLICQCNMSPIAAASPGQHTPIDQFEADIRQALGDKFKTFTSRDQLPTDDGRTILRVIANGEMSVTGEQGTVKLPMNWIYYLCADRTGKQMSFVFVIEPEYLKLLAGRDLEMVKSVRFTR
jgi:hypothetical protein